MASVYKIYIANILSAITFSTASAIEYILYVLYLLAKVLVSSRLILAKLKILLEVLL